MFVFLKVFNYNILFLKFPHASTSFMKEILFFHETCLFLVMFIMSTVFIMMTFVFFSSFSISLKLEKSKLEMMWTVLPSLMILLLLSPSIYTLYFSEVGHNTKTLKKIKVVGHQWYWEYNYHLFDKINNKFQYDSYYLNDLMLIPGDYRKSEVDLPLIINIQKKNIFRLILTSADTIHSYYIPEFGVKVDCVPGRLNQHYLMLYQTGLYYGYCAELCGVNHSFMPMVAEVVYLKN